MSVRVNGEALVPDIAGLTAKVRARLIDGGHQAPLDKLTEFLSVRGVDTPNVEVLLTHVRLLKSIALDQGVEGFSQADLDDLETGICDAIAAITDCELPTQGTPYHSLAAWAGSIERSVPVEIFTTNYDLLVEQALERIRVPYFDGFVGARHAFIDSRAIDSSELPPRWLRLWKLHGSVNWFQLEHHVARTSKPPEGPAARLIHPSHLKYEESRRMPFLAMMDRLTDFLRQPGAVLISAGYSFGDQHLNERMVRALEENQSAALIALQFGDGAANEVANNLAAVRPNMSVLTRDQATVGTITAPWAVPQPVPADLEGWVDVVDAKLQFHLGDFACLGRFLAEKVVGGFEALLASGVGDDEADAE